MQPTYFERFNGANRAHYFKQLHSAEQPLLLANVWDPKSAKQAEEAGYRAVGTSSAAISQMLGLNDGQGMTFDELFFFVERIIKHVAIPVSVDMEAGYAENPAELGRNLQKLIDVGVSGINIEDSLVVNKVRSQVSVDTYANTLSCVRAYLDSANSGLFVNARIDSYLLGRNDALEDALVRVLTAEKSGADGVFVPGVAKSAEIGQIVSSTSLPLNTYALPGVPSYEELAQLGVKRISSGETLYVKTYTYADKLFKTVAESRCFDSLF